MGASGKGTPASTGLVSPHTGEGFGVTFLGSPFRGYSWRLPLDDQPERLPSGRAEAKRSRASRFLRELSTLRSSSKRALLARFSWSRASPWTNFLTLTQAVAHLLPPRRHSSVRCFRSTPEVGRSAFLSDLGSSGTDLMAARPGVFFHALTSSSHRLHPPWALAFSMLGTPPWRAP